MTHELIKGFLDAEEPQLDVASLAYALRQRVVVVEDEVAFAGRRASALVAEGDDEEAKSVLGEVLGEDEEQLRALLFVLPLAAIAPGPTLIRAGAVFAPLVGNKVIDLLKKARKQHLRILPIAISETRQLRFPAGDPVEEVLYLGNPVSARDYYPAASFHRLTFEHKYTELVRLLSSLGATKVDATAIKGFGKEFGLDGEGAGFVKGKASRRRSNVTSLERHLTLTPCEPRTPRGLAWLDREDEWLHLVELQEERRLKRHTVALRYDDNYGIDAKFVAKIEDINLALGGSFEDQSSTVWSIDAHFDHEVPPETSDVDATTVDASEDDGEV